MFQVVDLITGFFQSIFGNGLIMMLILLSVILLMLLTFRASAEVILIILIPLITGVVLNMAFSDFLAIPVWILLSLWIMVGFLVGALFFVLFK